MDNLGWTLDGEARPFLHGRTVEVPLGVLASIVSLSRTPLIDLIFLDFSNWFHTSKVIHDIGSSWGISVRLTSLRVKFSSSNWTVKMAPGGVQVPIIK